MNVEWEFSKKLTFIFVVIFAIHMVAHLVSAMMSLGDYRLIKDSFIGSLPFYSVAFATYMGKSTFENYDKHKSKLKEMDCDDESVG